MSTATPSLPRADEQERYLVACCLDWPERATEILALCKPTDFWLPLHQQLWRRFKTQLAMTGTIDRLAVGKELDCCEFLVELIGQAPTTAYAPDYADAVKLAARGRQIHEVLAKGAAAIERGRPGDAVLSQVQMALEPFAAEAIG